MVEATYATGFPPQVLQDNDQQEHLKKPKKNETKLIII